MTELGFLGAGNMGSAIMRGICSSDMQISVSAYDKDTAKLEALSAFGVKPCKSECELVKKCDYILLAVKPQVLGGVLDTRRGSNARQGDNLYLCGNIRGFYPQSYNTERKGSACYAEHPYDARSWRKRNIKSGRSDR